MSWFRVDADMPDHPKTRALARRLPGVDPVGLVARTWAWMSRFCRTGHVVTCHVTPFAESLASSIGWTGDPSDLVAGLCDAGWLDRNEDGSVEAHDWDEKQQKVASKAEKDRERQRAYRAKKKASVTRDTCDSRAVTNTHVTPQRNETERDVTEQLEALRAEPAASGELFESPPPQPTNPPSPLKSKPPKPPRATKAEKPPDPRHHPLLEAMVVIFGEVRGQAPSAVNGAWAKGVADLLAIDEPYEVVRRWRLALVSRYPTVVTPLELARHWDHWSGDKPAVDSSARGLDPNQGIIRHA